MRDFYEVLGVPKDADASAIKKAYRRMAMEHHPDRNPGDKDAEEKFKEASNAYKVLSDENDRARYDRFGHAGVGGSGGAPGAGFQGFHGVDDIFSQFGDLFGDFFGGGAGRARGPRRGNDLQLELLLSFSEAVHGVSKEVEITKMEPCSGCEGSGAKKGSKPVVCTSCKGKGQVVHSQGFFMVQTTCPACRGQGKIIKDKCVDCKGGGTQRAESKLNVTVPAGVDEGQTLRLAGKGEASVQGGSPGHLYVILRVEPDKRFIREGENILSDVKLNYLTAILGGEVEIPTLDDECTGTETIEVQAGTQPDDVHVRRGQGIAVPGRGKASRGDHVIRYKVEIPKKIGKKERELLENLASEVGVEVSKKKGIFRR